VIGGAVKVLELGNFKLINKALRWDTATSNHIKLMYWDRVVRDWDVTGLAAP
jgi:hypothetical protein